MLTVGEAVDEAVVEAVVEAVGLCGAIYVSLTTKGI